METCTEVLDFEMFNLQAILRSQDLGEFHNQCLIQDALLLAALGAATSAFGTFDQLTSMIDFGTSIVFYSVYDDL